jgi:hypothetical protein
LPDIPGQIPFAVPHGGLMMPASEKLTSGLIERKNTAAQLIISSVVTSQPAPQLLGLYLLELTITNPG